MPTEVYLLKVGMSMTEGVVEEWYIADGDPVTQGELLYRLETEKVNLDVDAEAAGTVKHLVSEGITMSPGDVVGYIYAEGETIPENLAAAAPGATTQSSAPPVLTATIDPDQSAAATTTGGRGNVSPMARRLAVERNLDLGLLQGTGPGGRIVEADVLASSESTPAAEKAEVAQPTAPISSPVSSPMARKLARELGMSLQGIRGSGPGGRITKEDVEAAASAPAAAVIEPSQREDRTAREDQSMALKGMRRTIATRMHESLASTAQLTMDMDVRMDDAIKLRSQLITEWADKGVRPTYTDLVIRAAAKALASHPQMNSELTDSELILRGEINVGMAVALEEGLIVPVLRYANGLSMEATAQKTARLAESARAGSLSPDDLQGGTFTVTALGMFGVDSFTPILNAPQAGILGVNRIRDATAWDNGVPSRIQMMRLSLTWDHRVLDGAPAAEFLAEVRDLLEAPYRLLI